MVYLVILRISICNNRILKYRLADNGEEVIKKMDARIKKIQVEPAKVDKAGVITSAEKAVISIEVPLDSDSQLEKVVELLALLRSEFVKVDITAFQKQLDIAAD